MAKVIYVLYVILCNIALIVGFFRYQAPIQNWVGVFPESLIYYLIVITALAIGNWTLGWHVMKSNNK